MINYLPFANFFPCLGKIGGAVIKATISNTNMTDVIRFGSRFDFVANWESGRDGQREKKEITNIVIVAFFTSSKNQNAFVIVAIINYVGSI